MLPLDLRGNGRSSKPWQINDYLTDDKFRSRDPKFQNQKDEYGKRHQ